MIGMICLSACLKKTLMNKLRELYRAMRHGKDWKINKKGRCEHLPLLKFILKIALCTYACKCFTFRSEESKDAE